MTRRLPESRESGPAGATLVELLVAMGVLSLMAVLLLGGMRLGLRIWESGDEQQGFEQRLERADGFLRQLIGESSIALGQAPAPRAASDWGFRGAPAALSFTAPLPYQLGSAGRYVFELAGHHAGKGVDLVLAWNLMTPAPVGVPVGVPAGEAAGAAPANQTVLLADIRAVHFAYFGRLPSEAAMRWHEDWSGLNGLPSLIRLEIVLAHGRLPERMILYYAPRLSINGA